MRGRHLYLLIVCAVLPRLAGAEPGPAGPLAQRARYTFALYFTPRPKLALEAAQARCKKRVSVLGRSEDGPTVVVRSATPAELPPPGLDLLEHFAVGVSAAEKTAVQNSAEVVVIGVSAPADRVLPALRDAGALTDCLAREMGALVADTTSRTIFGGAAWHKARVEGWKDLRHQIVVHQYPEGDGMRSVTLGMAKLGLPDLAVNQHPRFLGDPIVSLLNRSAEALMNAPRLVHAGRLDIGGVDVRIEYMKPEPGDDDRVLALELGDAEQQSALLRRLYGAAPEPMAFAKAHDRELAAIKLKVQAEIPALARRFQAGLRPDERLDVKAPFAAPDGQVEWMWVEVDGFRGAEILGKLDNDPQYVPTLKLGSAVKVRAADVADYALFRGDEIVEGNASQRVLEHRR
jgi:uncharacterized protein YegJ (DUF2314 family)